MWTWNEFLLALVMIQSDDLRTAPLGLALFAGANRDAGPDARRRRRRARRAAGRDRLRVPAAQLHPRHVRRGGEGMSWAAGASTAATRRRSPSSPAPTAARSATGRGGCSDIYNAATPERRARRRSRRPRARRSPRRASTPRDVAPRRSASPARTGRRTSRCSSARCRERLGLRAPPLVVNDALGALRGGSPDWTGVAVVSGTYNAIGARHPDGRVFHLGFWPDGAGGRHLGGEALDAVYRAAPRHRARDRADRARARALRRAPTRSTLLHAFTRRGGLGEAEQDRLAPVLLDAADDGDAVAHGDRGRQGPRPRRAGARLRGPARAAARRDADRAHRRRLRAPDRPARRRHDGRAARRRAGPPRPAADRRRAAARARPARRRRRRAASRRASRPTDGRSARWAGSPSRA